MPEWLISGLLVLASTAIPSVIVFALSRINTKKLGKQVGRAITTLGQRKGGKGYEKVERRFQTSLSDFIDGVQEGLDSDDG